MIDSVLALLVVFVVVYIARIKWREVNRHRWILKEDMPLELQEARLVGSEKYIETYRPRKMNGAYDQLYKLKASKVHVIVDSKTRKRVRVYKKDIVQLSLYRVILQRKGFEVADYAYFRVVTKHGVKYVKETLLNEELTVAEYDNAKAVLDGKKEPLTAENQRMCKGCGQQPNCKKWQFAD